MAAKRALYHRPSQAVLRSNVAAKAMFLQSFHVVMTFSEKPDLPALPGRAWPFDATQPKLGYLKKSPPRGCDGLERGTLAVLAPNFF
jgi:hypothetical protein